MQPTIPQQALKFILIAIVLKSFKHDSDLTQLLMTEVAMQKMDYNETSQETHAAIPMRDEGYDSGDGKSSDSQETM